MTAHIPGLGSRDAEAIVAAAANGSLLTQSAATPIFVALMTDHYFGPDYARTVPNCTVAGLPLDCTFRKPAAGEDALADLLW